LTEKCVIAGAGDCILPLPPPSPGDFVIAADGGAAALQKSGITPDLFIGDFDSLPDGFVLPVDGGESSIIRLPREKDDTDMLAAIKEGWKRGLRLFHIYGGLGGRLDHSIANIQCAAAIARRGGRAVLFGQNETLTVIHNCSINFESGLHGTISVFAVGGRALGVCENGLKYKLQGADLSPDHPIGVSNEFTGQPAAISVESGSLLILTANRPASIWASSVRAAGCSLVC
jgi:thiamine pyrophosphokinase